MKEAIFNSEVMVSLKSAGAWAYKIADSPASWTWRRTRFTPEKPCDILFCFKGVFGAIEGKQIKRFQSFGLKKLRPSQLDHLERISQAGGRAFIFLNVRIRAARGPVVKGRWTGSNHENRLIILDWDVWGPLLEILPLSGKEVQALPHLKGRKGVFDLGRFLGQLAR